MAGVVRVAGGDKTPELADASGLRISVREMSSYLTAVLFNTLYGPQGPFQ